MDMVVMFSSLENQLHSHAKTRVHGLHHAMNAQFEILRTHEDFDACARRERRGHFDVAPARTDVGKAAAMGHGNACAEDVGTETAGMTGLSSTISR